MDKDVKRVFCAVKNNDLYILKWRALLLTGAEII